jgi:hypothetical protein
MGPSFLEKTVKAERYQNLLTEFISLLEERENDCWFRHDRATAHTANTAALLQEFFDERIVGRRFWPP